MTQSTTLPADRLTLTARPGASRKLLARKASEKLASGQVRDSVEHSFPTAPSEAALGSVPAVAEAVVNVPFEPSPKLLEPAAAIAAPAAGIAAQPVPAWSDEDERAFKTQAARRKAAGYRAHGRNLGTQLITVGGFKPNPNTTVAVIVGLVAEHGSVTRSELVDAMASVAFPHHKAQPGDKSWCQGYVAGAIRNGFLSASDDNSLAVGEA